VTGDQNPIAAGCPLDPETEAISKLIGADGRQVFGGGNGASGTRTHDLPAASRTLSQLSYSPEPVLACKVNAGALCILGRSDPESNRTTSVGDLDRDQESFVQFLAVDSDRVDLVDGICRPNVARRRMTGSADPHADDSGRPIECSPFALDPHDLGPEVEQKVIAPVLCERLQHIDAQLDRFQGNCSLSDVSLVVCGEHPAILARAV
jgi:hypothetical protein